MGRSYKQMSRMTFNADPDPRYIGLGLAAMVIMAPLTVLAVPADLAATPFRRQCGFEFHAEGKLKGWAGAPAGGKELEVQLKSLVGPGVENVKEPSYIITRSSTTSDEHGRFELKVAGHLPRAAKIEVHWLVDGLPSGLMYLRKRGGKFVLSEDEPEFGTGLETIEPIVIKPRD
ncbi:MAG: hypothetical protein HY924_09980 [Elusimicrobia bacterium]|nr:hypothetical protein [Elusimicrobiota bacterium]